MTTIAGVLLAAGASSRMGGPNKLLLPVGGKPLVRWPAEALWDGGLGPLLAVVGRDAGAVREALGGLPYRFVENPGFEQGMAGSLRAGVAALGENVEAVAVALGDLPGLRGGVVRFLASLFRESPQGIVVPVHEDRRGHPVILDLKRYREELLGLTGDEGARSILARHPDDVLEAPVYDPGVITDVDTRDAYEALGRNR